MNNRSSLFVLLIIIINSMNSDAAPTCPARSNRYYYDPYQDEDMMCEGEEMCSLSMATLRTILRGLVAVLTQIFPECASAQDRTSSHGCSEKKEEPIKIFRQIVSCPSLPIPYYPCCQPPPTQIPPPPTIMHTSI